jgi:exonuclease VII small subunit
VSASKGITPDQREVKELSEIVSHLEEAAQALREVIAKASA